MTDMLTGKYIEGLRADWNRDPSPILGIGGEYCSSPDRAVDVENLSYAAAECASVDGKTMGYANNTLADLEKLVERQREVFADRYPMGNIVKVEDDDEH